MSLIDRPDRRTLPPLVRGERLDRATFHERYEAMPPDVRAELVGGIVYIMASPLSYRHGRPDHILAGWLVHYQLFTPSTVGASNASTFFDDYGEPQPDQHLRIHEDVGGASRVEDNYLVGPPELIVEVGYSSRKYDLGPKKADYLRAGVAEYLFVGTDPEEVRWFALRKGRYIGLTSGEDGIYRSEVFPGLWLDPQALFSGDLPTLIAVLGQGLATPEHAAFVRRLSGAG